MLNIRKAEGRGRSNIGWLNSQHTFSFADYHDSRHMGYGALRVINDDRVAPAAGFGTHPHRDMEIISYVLEGALEHRDSMGNGGVIKPGDVQRMSAGTGVAHSEFNHSKTDPVHFLQIWIIPDATGHEPGYEQVHFEPASKRGRFRLIASNDGQQGSVSINQDAKVYAGLFDAGESATVTVSANRICWIHIATGAVSVNGEQVSAGDGISVSGPQELLFEQGHGAEVLVFDLPAEGGQ